MITVCRVCNDTPGADLCEECKKSLIDTGTIHEICDAIRTYDEFSYNVCTYTVGAYHYCVLVESYQDEATVIALGRGRTVEQSERQCAINYRRSRLEESLA